MKVLGAFEGGRPEFFRDRHSIPPVSAALLLDHDDVPACVVSSDLDQKQTFLP